jgi:hypothetical protein
VSSAEMTNLMGFYGGFMGFYGGFMGFNGIYPAW